MIAARYPKATATLWSITGSNSLDLGWGGLLAVFLVWPPGRAFFAMSALALVGLDLCTVILIWLMGRAPLFWVAFFGAVAEERG